jgi:hypothetical protein
MRTLFRTTVAPICLLAITASIALPGVVHGAYPYHSDTSSPDDAVNDDYNQANPCRALTTSGSDSQSNPRDAEEYDDGIPREGTTAGGGGGNYVPVKDFEQENLQEQTNELIRETNDRITNTNSLIRPQTTYLRILCEKAMVEDRNIQHQWQNVLSELVISITGWINTAYNGTPMYVTNPHVYYRQVDIGVVNAMEQEVEEAADNGLIDDDESFRIRQMLARSRAAKAWGSNAVADWTTRDPAAKAIFENRDRFSFDAMYQGVSNPRNNVTNKFRTVRSELRQRLKSARDVEQQKLNWGEGYFSWEECGQDVFSGNEIDIRTCRILTPGSTVQDLSTALFSSTIRQMEQADEYKEWISSASLHVLNTTMGVQGLRTVGDRYADDYNPLSSDNDPDDPWEDALSAEDASFWINSYNEDNQAADNTYFYSPDMRPKAKIDAYLNEL